MISIDNRQSVRRLGVMAGAIGTAWCFVAAACAAEPLIRPDIPNAVTFPAQQAKFVRFVIHASANGQPCIDELEVYAPNGKRNLALADQGAEATASSCLAGYRQHTIEHLNDGRYGNEYSWIPAQTSGEWAQIELPFVHAVSRVVFSRDRTRHYADRVPIHFEVRLSLDGKTWQTVKKVVTKAARVAVRPRRGGFAAFIPDPPPPPSRGRNGIAVVATQPRDMKVPPKDEAGFANLALGEGAKPAAVSVLPGHAIHQISHLNDGLAGNDHSWVGESNPCWAEIDLGDVYFVYSVAIGSDSSGRYQDRAATTFSILTATEYNRQTTAKTWKTAYKQVDGLPVRVRAPFKFKPVRARWVRVAIDATDQSAARIDEIEIFGQKEPIPLAKIGPLPEPKPAKTKLANTKSDAVKQLRDAFLGEEHAWLKIYGRADLSSRLVPYNGRVQQYPRHVGDDTLPLPPLSTVPELDGKMDDPCWRNASRGVVRVADPYDFELGPLVETAVAAGHKDGQLYLAVATNRLLSSHVAIVSGSDGGSAGVLALAEKGLVFNTYEPSGKLKQSRLVSGAVNGSLTCVEVQLPLELFPGCRTQGLRIGLGMGGKHTKPHGRPVNFVFAPLSIVELSPCVNGTFRVRLAAASDGPAVKISGNAAGLQQGLTLAPGQSKVISFRGQGPIGPEFEFAVQQEGGESYTLHLLRYDPLERTLSLMEEMLERFAAQGRDVAEERSQLAELRGRQQKLQAAEPDLAAERQAFFDARLAKRRLFFREPDLAGIENILFVKRHAFEPSHNYSVLLDSRYRPGGGIYSLHVPRHDGRFEPGEAEVTRLFDSGGGIARNPMANFDLTKVYFGYRPSAKGYYHVMEMTPDGSSLKQITHGPFHDYWPCPLPDGGLAFITTRCRARFLCWRPQAAVLFRMDADGNNIRPLSFANLTEWGPSVMSDGRIIWQRSEYIDKGADFGHTLWAIRPDGTKPELVFGNDIIQPNGYANGREVPGTTEFLCTLISHFGDLNGPLALVNPSQGRFNPKAITTLTPEVPRPGMWPRDECFRDPVPLARDYFLCAHAPQDRFGLYVIDRFGNREVLYLDPKFGSMCPTLFHVQKRPPVLPSVVKPSLDRGEFVLADVYQGISHRVERGRVKYLRVCQEVRAGLEQLPDGSYRHDHPSFQDWYATPVHKVSGPYGWPSYVAKASLGIVPVEKDGSARFYAPAGRVLYFEALDKDFNELQRMRSVVQLQPGEKRSCIGCHEGRNTAVPSRPPLALGRPPTELEPPPWGAEPFAYEEVVQPVWNRHCIGCHDAADKRKLNFTATLDGDKVPASYRTLISQGWVHYLDCGYNSGGTEKREPLSFGTLKSKLWQVLDRGHYGVKLTREEKRRIKCWTDLNCPLWPDYILRDKRPSTAPKLASASSIFD